MVGMETGAAILEGMFPRPEESANSKCGREIRVVRSKAKCMEGKVKVMWK